MTSPYDITYCAYAECPFKDCDIHMVRVKNFLVDQKISVADYSGTCRRYIGWLVDEEEKRLLAEIQSELEEKLCGILERGKGAPKTEHNARALEGQCAIYLNGAPVEALCFLPLVCNEVQGEGEYSIIFEDGSHGIAEFLGRCLDFGTRDVTVGYKASVKLGPMQTIEIVGDIVAE